MDTRSSSRDPTPREAAIVGRHLPDGYSAGPESLVASNREDREEEEAENEEPTEASSLALQGGDMHRDIFKIKARGSIPRRANTFSGHRPSTYESDHDDISVNGRIEPGGFRRDFVQRTTLTRRLSSVATPVTRNFVSFLELYGSFAGENLADTDDEDDESALVDDEPANSQPPSETRPLLPRRKSTKRSKASGDASTLSTFFTLMKAFVGTGIMFLPKAFRNGGILFSSITLVAVSLVTCLCFRLLLQCRKQCGGSGYGDIGSAIAGSKFRSLILASITLSQLGFVCAGIIFTAENLLSFAEAMAAASGKAQPFGVNALIAIQFVVLVPLALIRNISKLGPAALLADVFILIGIIYIWYYDIAALASRGVAPDLALFNPSSFTLTVGSAIFTFEGIGLILPIQSSMKKPEHFSSLLYLVMAIITVVFTSVGALCYATFGEQTKIQIISNFPQDSKLVNAVQFLYSMAVLVGEPVQLFPAVRILEVAIFGERASGKKSASVKWQKNALRGGMMVLCLIVAIIGASDLDKFVALIGSFACVPLVYIYPPFLHYRGVAESTREKLGDIAMMTLGIVAMVYTTTVTVKQWVSN